MPSIKLLAEAAPGTHRTAWEGAGTKPSTSWSRLSPDTGLGWDAGGGKAAKPQALSLPLPLPHALPQAQPLSAHARPAQSAAASPQAAYPRPAPAAGSAPPSLRQ